MHRVALVVAVLVAAPSVLAESPLPPCNSEWWHVEGDVPIDLTEVPVFPTLFLPARAGFHDGMDEARLIESVTVDVRDAQGESVAGQIDIAPSTDSLYRLARLLRWRPTSALTAGERYTIELSVADAPEGWAHERCPKLLGFTRSMAFTVAVAPVVPPSLELSMNVLRNWTVDVHYGSCDVLEYEARCDSPAGICCKAQRSPRWTVSSHLTIAGVLPPPLYTVARFEIEWPGGGLRRLARHPVRVDQTVEAVQTGSDNGASSTEAFCVTATVVNLMSDEVLASKRACPEAEDFTREERPPLLSACEQAICNEHVSEPAPVEPGPESVEPSPEVVEPGPEPSDEVDVAEATADPEWDQSSSGCGVGSVGWFALILFGLLRFRRQAP